MNEELLKAYKAEILKHYLSEQKGIYSQYLLNPTRAKLRDLCVERFKNNPTSDELSTFRIFFGFDFNETNLNDLYDKTDKLRPIENFLKSTTDYDNLEGLNMAAILLDFEPRPYRKFALKYSGVVENEDETEINEEKAKSNEEINDSQRGKNTTEGEREPKVPVVVLINEEAKANNNKASFFTVKKKMVLRLGAGVLLAGAGFFSKGLIFPNNKYMAWMEDHYELVEGATAPGIQAIAYDSEEFNRRKLHVCDTTHFFRNSEPIVWYSKQNNEIEFFNMDGKHPETGAELSRITQYMIDKYVEPCD